MRNCYRIRLISGKNEELRGRPVILNFTLLRSLPVKKFAHYCVSLRPAAGHSSASARIPDLPTHRLCSTDVSPHTSERRQVFNSALAMRGEELFSNNPAADQRRQ
jgi:hypothetical protein